MGSMYGNITQHIPRTNFKFAAVYPSRLAMALDERNYWNYDLYGKENNYSCYGPDPKYIHKIQENDYVLVNYTILPKGNYTEEEKKVIFEARQKEDIENENIFAYEIDDDGNKIGVKQTDMKIVEDTESPFYGKEVPIYNGYFEDLIENGGTFAPGDYHMTVWQKQRVRVGEDVKPTYVAICRLHSILPTFETWGSYHIDILDSLSSYPDAFGAGKEWWYPQKPSSD